MILFMWNAEKRQIHREWELISGFLGLELGEKIGNGDCLVIAVSFLLGMLKTFQNQIVVIIVIIAQLDEYSNNTKL